MTNETTAAAGIAAWVAVFLSERAAELSPYSVIHLRASLMPMARALGDDAGAVTYADLRAYVDALALRYKPGTLRPTVGDIRQFWRWAKRKRLIDRNPAKRLRPPSRRVVTESAAPKSAPESDVAQVLGYLAGRLSTVVYRDLFGNLCPASLPEWSEDARHAARDLFVLAFLYETGCRAGELHTLPRRAMVDATAAPGPVYRVVASGKTGAVTLRFTAPVAELWLVWDAVRPAACAYAVYGWKSDGLPSAMTTQTISRMLARHCERVGVAPFRAHALRHAKVKRARGAVGVETAARLIGHSSAAMTAAYGVADDDELSAAALATGLSGRLWG